MYMQHYINGSCFFDRTGGRVAKNTCPNSLHCSLHMPGFESFVGQFVQLIMTVFDNFTVRLDFHKRRAFLQ